MKRRLISAAILALTLASAFAEAPAGYDDYIRAGDDKFSAGDFSSAAAFFDSALIVRPNDTAALIRKGRAKQNMGLNADAVRDFDAAIAIDPNISEAWWRKGYALFDLKDESGATESFARAIEINPKDAHAFTARDLPARKEGFQQHGRRRLPRPRDKSQGRCRLHPAGTGQDGAGKLRRGGEGLR